MPSCKEKPQKIKAVLCLLFSLLLFDCASLFKVQKKAQDAIKEKRYKKAAKIIERAQRKYRSKNSLLYYLDYGLTLHLVGRYEESNRYFKKAKAVYQQHYTKSISRHLGSFLINDNVLPYYGEGYEQILLRLFSALNYLKLNALDDALVEMRQADFLLTQFETDYGDKTTYKEDAFLRYFSGLLYEMRGDVNNAQVAFYKALLAYEKYKKFYQVDLPAALIQDVLRTATQIGFQERIEEITKKYDTKLKPFSIHKGELIFLHFNGFAPFKTEFFFELSLFGALPYLEAEEVSSEEEIQVNQTKAAIRSIGGKQLIRVAFAKMKKNTHAIESSQIEIKEHQISTSLVQNIGGIVIQNLEDKNARIKGKSIARALVKYVSAHAASAAVSAHKGKGLGFLTQAILQTTSTLTERADIRSWRTLHDQVRMGRMELPPGTYDLLVKFKNGDGKVISSKSSLL